MLHLLTETSIFMSLPNGCLCQLAGEPIIYLTPKLQDTSNPPLNAPTDGNQEATGKRLRPKDPSDTEERPNKRRRLDASKIKAKNALGKQYVNTPLFWPQVDTLSSSPADITFTRVRLFHSKPNFIPQTNQILVGLPLNRRLLSRSTHSLDSNYIHRCVNPINSIVSWQGQT